jgi:hypothetical protein
VEAPERCNYSGAACSYTRKFESAFHSLGTTVTEKDLRKSVRQKVYKAFKQPGTHIIVENFGTGDESLRLRCNGGSNLWSSMPDVCYPIARGAVDIFASIYIPY